MLHVRVGHGLEDGRPIYKLFLLAGHPYHLSNALDLQKPPSSQVFFFPRCSSPESHSHL